MAQTQHRDGILSDPVISAPFQPHSPPIDELALAEIKSAILVKLTLTIGKEILLILGVFFQLI